MRATMTMAALLAGALAASRADAQHMGAGSGKSAVTAPATKDSGADERPELPADRPPIEPRHGILGVPGAAQDSAGPSRLGAPADRSARPSYGESAEAGAGSDEAHETWRSGDLVRSWTSADVRASRQQQAPDLEWTTARGAAPGGQSPPSHRREVRKERGVTKR